MGRKICLFGCRAYWCRAVDCCGGCNIKRRFGALDDGRPDKKGDFEAMWGNCSSCIISLRR